MFFFSPVICLPQIQCLAVTWSEWGRSLGLAWAYGEAIVGNPETTRADLTLPYFGGKPVHTCSSQVESRLPTALLLVLAVLQRGLSPLGRTPGLGHPICGLNLSLPRAGVCPSILPFPLSPLPGAQVLTQLIFFPSEPIICVSFLQPWLYRSLSASFQLVFHDNCSTCRHILDVFVGEGKPHTLSLYHLE